MSENSNHLGINLGNLKAYTMVLPTLRMMGFTLPTPEEIYMYTDDNVLQAFLDLIANEMYEFYSKEFTREQIIQLINNPYYNMLANDIEDVCAVLPDSLFRRFLDKILVFKQSGGDGSNSKSYNKYTTAEFKTEEDVVGGMRGGELDQAQMDAMNAKTDEVLIPELQALFAGGDAAKAEVLEYLEHLRSNPARLDKIRKTLGIPAPPDAAPAASAAPVAVPVAASAAPVAASAAPVAASAAPVAPAPASQSNTLALPSKLLMKWGEYVDPKLKPENKQQLGEQLALLTEKKSDQLMIYAVHFGSKLNGIAGDSMILTTSSSKQEIITIEAAINLVEQNRDIDITSALILRRKADFLSIYDAQTKFFSLLNKELSTNGGANIKIACKEFFNGFKPAMVSAVDIATGLAAFKQTIFKKKTNLIKKFGVTSINTTQFKTNNAALNKAVQNTITAASAKAGVYGGVAGVSNLGFMAFHLMRRGYTPDSITPNMIRKKPVTTTSTTTTVQATQPKLYQNQPVCGIESRPVSTGAALNYGTVMVPGYVIPQNCGTLGWAVGCTPAQTVPSTLRPRTEAEAVGGGHLAENPASDFECRPKVCAPNMNWHHGQNQCIPRVPADPEKEWKMTGINLLSGNGEGSEVDKKFQERMGEETTFLQFIGSCVTLGLYNPSGQQKQCSKSSLFNVQCWQSWVGEGGTQVVRGLGTVAGYGMEAGGSAIRTGLWLARGTGDLALVSSALIGARGSLNHTTTEWRQLRDAMAEITQLETFVEKMENIKTGLDAAIEKATTEYMCAIFKKYILPDIQQMKINLTSITKVVDGKAVQETPEAGSAEANNLNRQIILELAKICDMKVMEELAEKLQFDQKLDESRKPKQAGPVPVALIRNTAGAAPGVAPPQYKMTDLDWFRLFLPHYTTRYMTEFTKASGTGEEAAKKSKEDILKEAISHNIASGKSRMIDANTMTNLQTKYGQLREMIGLYDETDPKKKGLYTAELASFQSILKHHEELSKISVADAGTDWALLEKGFAFVGSSLKQRQEAAAAAELNRQQKAQEATNMAAAIAAAREPLERELREAKARTEQVARNATAAQALAVERAKGEATKNALARERTAANAISRAAAQAAANALARVKAASTPAPAPLALAPAPLTLAPSEPAPSAPAPSAPAPSALAPAPSATGSRGGQLRNREAEGGRRLPRGRTQKHRKSTARKIRVSRKYRV